MTDYHAAYAVLALVLLAGAAFCLAGFAANRLLAPRVPTAAKLMPYECGVDPVGEGWAQTQVRYYVFAYLYVIFAVDVMYLFPWATVFAAPGYGLATLVEMGIFLGFLGIGLLYAWRRGVLTWV